MSDERINLSVEWSLLQEQWAATRQAWRDEVAARFEATCWEDCLGTIPELLEAIELLDEAIYSTQREHSDEQY